MMRHIAHRIFGILLVLALALGPVANGARAASMGAKMLMMASNDVDAPGKCDDCDAAKAGMNGVCSAMFCSGLNVLPPAGEVAFEPLFVNRLPPCDARVMAGRSVVPDPHPPRQAIQS